MRCFLLLQWVDFRRASVLWGLLGPVLRVTECPFDFFCPQSNAYQILLRKEYVYISVRCYLFALDCFTTLKLNVTWLSKAQTQTTTHMYYYIRRWPETLEILIEYYSQTSILRLKPVSFFRVLPFYFLSVYICPTQYLLFHSFFLHI